MKTTKILISIGLSFLLLGCNSNSNKSDKSEIQKLSVPTEIDMKLPKVLKNSSGTQKRFKKIDEVSTNKDRGYVELKSNVANAEEELKIVKINLLLAEKIMPQIQLACADIPVTQTCEIAEGELSFVLDSEMRNDIANIIDESFPTNTADKKMTLGKSTFTIYGDAEDYQYVLAMDMSTMIRQFETDKATYIQTIKWSKDENRIWSIYSQEDKDTTSSMSVRYTKNAEGQTQMEIDESFNGSVTSSASSSMSVDSNDTISLENDTPTIENIAEEFHFKITNKEDYFKIISNSSYLEDKKQMYIESSIGEVSDKGGYLNFKGVFLDSEYRETNKFDANGSSVFSAYCDSSQECDLNDETTWLEQGDITFEPAIEVQMIELSVTGGDLKEGNYLLLAPNSDIDKLSVEEVFDASVGDIYVDKDLIFGTLYKKEYLNELDNLVMVRLIFNMDEAVNDTKVKASFEPVNGENRPILREK